jgi:hypothetical protein
MRRLYGNPLIGNKSIFRTNATGHRKRWPVPPAPIAIALLQGKRFAYRTGV